MNTLSYLSQEALSRNDLYRLIELITFHILDNELYKQIDAVAIVFSLKVN